MIYTPRVVEFDKKVGFALLQPLHFPVFELVYQGQRKVENPRLLRHLLFHDFQVASAHGSQRVSWSNGTGDIGPVLFYLGSQRYALYLAYTPQHGWLDSNELVITPL